MCAVSMAPVPAAGQIQVTGKLPRSVSVYLELRWLLLYHFAQSQSWFLLMAQADGFTVTRTMSFAQQLFCELNKATRSTRAPRPQEVLWWARRPHLQLYYHPQRLKP